MVERRSEPRFRSLLGGRISFGNRQRTMDCIVRNIASSGAMVVFPTTSVTPKQFTLHIPCREQSHSATVIWRGHDRAGVALSLLKVAEAPTDKPARIRRLEAENELLKRQLDPRSL